ncbi:hypothetical protein UFOVP84_83 [uncultured Caudovirales phage]|uniref:Uncharacterized protein n=1 Tax=uncultured Caudovirales phage TaxID=2100421 RepID=A0A6J5L3X4_9CAUD|nr:hypothetical protein UFOVP84_83 [uncultured Caudovirales phage]
MKHKHCDLIKAWAEGAEIQHFCTYDNRWVDNEAPAWSSCAEYRIKPKNEFLKFRNALLKFRDGNVLIHAYYPRDYERIEESDCFVNWIGEEQTVNIGWLQ